MPSLGRSATVKKSTVENFGYKEEPVKKASWLKTAALTPPTEQWFSSQWTNVWKFL